MDIRSFTATHEEGVTVFRVVWGDYSGTRVFVEKPNHANYIMALSSLVTEMSRRQVEKEKNAEIKSE